MTKTAHCIQLLLAFQRRRSLATRDIMETLGVPKRSAIRYVQELQDAGVPIEHEGEGSARRAVLTREFVRSGGFVFSQCDAFALHIARAGVPHLDDTVVDEWLAELVDKLELYETKTTAERRRRFEQRFVHIADPYRPYAPHTEVLEALVDALLNSPPSRSCTTAAPPRTSPPSTRSP